MATIYVTDAKTGQLIPVDTTNPSGEINVIDQNTGRFVTLDIGGGGTPPTPASIWTQVLDESGASLTNFTVSTGTWASDGTQIKQTNTAASPMRLQINTPIRMDTGIFECEVQLRSSGSERQAGFLLGFDGSTAGAPAVKIREGNNDVELEREAQQVDASFPVTIDVNVYYKVKAIWSGTQISIYLDDVLLGTARSSSAYGNMTYLGLVTYQAEAWFRNIKAWNLNLPE